MNLHILFTLTFASLFVISSVSGAGEPVLDWAGKPVVVGTPYDLWAVGLNRGPVAIGNPIGDSACLRTVIDKQNHDPPHSPNPVSFFPFDVSETVVRVGKDYNILFHRNADRPCNVWQVNMGIGSPLHNFITTGGQSGFTGCENVNVWFQFELADADAHLYRIVFNPKTCNPNSNCPDYVTWEPLNGEDHLYLNQKGFLPSTYKPLEVNFSPNNSAIYQVWE